MHLTPLHQNEYEKLQQESSQTLTEIGSLERFSLLSSAGIFTWLLSHTGIKVHAISYALPAILVLLFGLIALGHFNRIKVISKYIRERYEVLLNTGQEQEIEYGWETYLNKLLQKRSSLLANSRLLMWILHLLGNLTLAITLPLS